MDNTLLYGRGANSIAEQIGKSKEEAQEIINKFFKAFPKVEEWIDKTHKKAKKLGYVEDWYGRRRRLPDIQLDDYIIEPKISKTLFNPFLECKDRIDTSLEKKINSYREELKNVKWNNQILEIIDKASKDNIYIRSNSILISQAERQSVNASIQGGAATLTKLAMINIYNDKELNDLDFHLLLTIHDEVLGECPKNNAEKVAQRLSEVMINTAKPYMNVPMACDTYVVNSWYEDEYAALIKSEYKKLEESGLNNIEAFNQLCLNHEECTKEYLKQIFEN